MAIDFDKLDPAYGDEISLREAVDILEAWRDAGNNHGLMYKINDEANIIASAKISALIQNSIVCKGENTRISVGLSGSRFFYGPMVVMEFPVREESLVKGLHIFMNTGNYLFISSQARLPGAKTSNLANLNLKIENAS